MPEADGFAHSDIHPVVARLYRARGITDPAQVDYRLNGLHRPDGLSQIDAAADLIADAIAAHKRIVVVGDFDADGATSTALCLRTLAACGNAHHDYLVPNRFDFGYGLTAALVGELEKMRAEVVITVDNGITSVNGVAAARNAGMQVIVTDHHLPGAQLPDAHAIVNPNLPGDAFASKNLAGVGVIFYLMAALRQTLITRGWFEQNGLQPPVLAQWLDLVALGTVADVVGLDHNNRILVADGLRRLRSGAAVAGINALLQVAGQTPEEIDENTLAFQLAPRLNAAGRLQDMSLGIDLLLCDDAAQALTMAEQLDEINQQRKHIQLEMQQFADSVLKSLQSQAALPAGLCLYHEGWHQGVVGLLASRVKDRTNRPVIAFARENEASDVLKGSARSVSGLHIRDVLVEIETRAPDLMIKYGGHAMAAGLSLKQANLNEFQALFNDRVVAHIGDDRSLRVIETDGSLDGEDLCLALAESLEQAGPWGQHFPPPLFDDWFVVDEKREVGQGHCKLVLGALDCNKRLEAIAFGIHPNEFAREGANVHLCYTPAVNSFRGRRSLQLMVKYLVQ